MVTRLTIQDHFRRLKDPRINRRKLHLLLDIMVIALCAVLCGATDWQQIEAFGKLRHDWLRRFLKLPNGIPSHDTFERVFDRIDPQANSGSPGKHRQCSEETDPADYQLYRSGEEGAQLGRRRGREKPGHQSQAAHGRPRKEVGQRAFN